MIKSTKKLTKEKFIEKAKSVHGDLYDYSKVEYINSATKVKIICNKHGEFEQRPNAHLAGSICLKCSNENNGLTKKLTKEKFIEKAKSVHGDLYDYSKIEYKGSHIKICIIHPEFGEFWQMPYAHLQGQGFDPRRNEDKNSFIEKAKSVHGDLYDYSKVEYKGSKIRVCIIHPEFGEFWQTPNAHLQGQGFNFNKKLTKEKFIEKAKSVHGDLYDYSKVEYINSTTDVCIVCNKHGEFKQTPKLHFKSGCPICKMSHGEREIYKYLKNKNIEFNREKKFDDCKLKFRLPFDFYIKKYNLCIEYDGRHHFEEIRGDFELIKKRDEIKNKYCLDKNIKLIRIPYWEKSNIEYILSKEFNDA